MLKRLSTVLLLGGLLFLSPAAATAAPVQPAQLFDLDRHRDDDHRRCMYRCDEREGRDRYRDRDRRDHERYRHRRYCWYRDRWGWYQAPCSRRHRAASAEPASAPDHEAEPAGQGILDHGEEAPDQDDHDHDGDGKPDHDPEDHDKDDDQPKPKKPKG